MVEGLSQLPWSLRLSTCLWRDSAPTCLATVREGAPAGPHLSGLSLAPQLESPLAISGWALGWRVWGGGQGPLAGHVSAAWPPGARSGRQSSLEVQGLALPVAQCSLGQERGEGAGQEGGAAAAPAPHSL